ncbi:hypothetical protein JCM16303_004839 [Sporobolomyces ruberrimus]
MSSVARTKRLNRELKECQKDATVEIEQIDDKIDHFIGSFPGPTGTPYEGGWFRVDVQAPERYPFEPLKMKFITKVYHPNVSSASGYICLDILKTSWSPVFTLRTCLVSLQSLLSTPEPNDPQDAEVAKHYLNDRKGFEETAKFWTEVYAAKPLPPGQSTSGSSTNNSRSLSMTSNEDPSIAKRPRIHSYTSAMSDESVEVIDPLEDVKRETKLAGLDWKDVETFSQMGFEHGKIIEVLKRLNWRKGNRERCSEDQVVEKLIDGS